jgi:hypothetical protein
MELKVVESKRIDLNDTMIRVLRVRPFWLISQRFPTFRLSWSDWKYPAF